MPGLCRYSKKAADVYPWTQAVLDDPHIRTPPPNDAQNTPQKLLKVREL